MITGKNNVFIKENHDNNRFIILMISFAVLILLFSFYFFSERNFYTGFASFSQSFVDKFITLSSLGRLSIDITNNLFKINIVNPQNMTYSFQVTDTNFTLPLDIFHNKNLSVITFTLLDRTHSQTVYQDMAFSPNTSIDSVRWSNELIINAYDINGRNSNKSVIYFVYVPNSPPEFEGLDSELYGCENLQFSQYFFGNDRDEQLLFVNLDPQHPDNPFFIRSFGQANLSQGFFRIFSGYLSKDDAGGVNAGNKTYTMTVTLSDGIETASKYINITVIEVNNPPIVENIGVHTIWTRGDNSTFFYKVNVTDIEDGNEDSGYFNFTINFTDEQLFGISNNGQMVFIANQTYLGTHDVSVCVMDRGLLHPHPSITPVCLNTSGLDYVPITRCQNFSLVVTDQNRPPVITSYFPNLSISAVSNTFLFFNITKYDPDSPALDTYWYVDDMQKEMDPYVNGSNNDNFLYSFSCAENGNHEVKAVITDGELNDSVTWNLSIDRGFCPVNFFGGTGGAGGGASRIVFCNESWGCDSWADCENLKGAMSFGKISMEYDFLIKERCKLLGWNDDVCGIQIRSCFELNHCWTTLLKPGIIQECYYSNNPNCNDNIRNCHNGSCEVLVDCGGPCEPCPTCNDGLKNQGETDIDCGGPCTKCKIIETPFFKKDSFWELISYSLIPLIILIIMVIVVLYIRYQQNKEELERISKKKLKLDEESL